MAPVAPAGGRPFQGQGRAAQPGGRAAQGGRQGRSGRAGYGGRRTTGIPPIVLVGFILSILGLCCAPVALVGGILCIVGLGEAKKRKEGVGLAIAGIVIGCLSFLIGIIYVVFTASMNGGGYNY